MGVVAVTHLITTLLQPKTTVDGPEDSRLHYDAETRNTQSLIIIITNPNDLRP